MLWTLLTGVTSIGLIGSALGTAYAANRGVGGYVLATAFGLLLAICNFWLWNSIANAAENHIKEFSESRQEQYLRVLYIAAMIWVPCAGILGSLLTGEILRRGS